MGPKRKSVQDGPNNVNVGEQATAKRRKQSTSPTTPSLDYDMLAEAILRKQSPPLPVLANSASVPNHMDVPNNNNNQSTMQPSCSAPTSTDTDQTSINPTESITSSSANSGITDFSSLLQQLISVVV